MPPGPSTGQKTMLLQLSPPLLFPPLMRLPGEEAGDEVEAYGLAATPPPLEKLFSGGVAPRIEEKREK